MRNTGYPDYRSGSDDRGSDWVSQRDERDYGDRDFDRDYQSRDFQSRESQFSDRDYGNRSNYGRQSEGMGQRGYGNYAQGNRSMNRGFGESERGGSYGGGNYGGNRDFGGGRDQGWDPNQGYGQRYQSRGGYSNDMMGGQEGPHIGKGPKGAGRSDDRIKELAHDQLTDHAHVDASSIEVAVHDGEVTLTGTVEDRNQKRMAEDCINQIRGVKDVHNQLRVQGQQTQGKSSSRYGEDSGSSSLGSSSSSTSSAGSNKAKA